jgi:hypothetical protein
MYNKIEKKKVPPSSPQTDFGQMLCMMEQLYESFCYYQNMIKQD